jgi:hypothetical protein
MRHSVRAEASGAARPLIFLLKAMRRAASRGGVSPSAAPPAATAAD